MRNKKMTDHIPLASTNRKLNLPDNGEVGTLAELQHLPCILIVGAAGLGKSTLLRANFDDARSRKQVGRLIHLDRIATDEDLIEAVLPLPHEAIDLSPENRWNLYVDGFDESRDAPNILIRRLLMSLRRLAERAIEPSKLRLRLVTRHAEIATSIKASLASIFPPKGTQIAELLELSDEEIAIFARSTVDNPQGFIRSVENIGVKPLAQRPLTLRLLVELYADNKSLPVSQRELYRNAISALLRRAGLDPEVAMLATAQLAAAMVLSNRLRIWTGDPALARPSFHLSFGDLDEPTSAAFEHIVPVLIKSGLLEELEPYELRWFHHSVAEYLTALHIDASGARTTDALELLQNKVLDELAIRPQLKDTAAWLAAFREDFLQKLIEAEPDVLLDSDVSISTSAARAALVAALIPHAEGTTWRRSDEVGRFSRLIHPDLAEQLKGFLAADAAVGERSRRLTVEIAKACDVREVVTDLIRLSFSSTESAHMRAIAAAAVDQLGGEEDRAMLLPLVKLSEEEDPDEEIRGRALQATWPHALQPSALFDALTLPRNPRLVGAYSYFIYTLKLPQLRSGEALAAAAWLLNSPPEYFESTFSKIASQALLRIWEAANDPDVLQAFAKLVARQINDWGHALRSVDVTNLNREIEAAPAARRKALFYKIIDSLTSAGASRAHVLVQAHPIQIIQGADLTWLTSEVSRPDRQTQYTRPLVDCIVSLAYRYTDIRDVGFVWDASGSSPELSAALADAFTVSLESEAASLMRQQLRYRQNQEQINDRLTEDTSVDQFNTLAASYAAGNRSAWWQANVVLLTGENGHQDETQSRLDSGPVWRALTQEQRTSALTMAEDYVANLDLGSNWLRPNQHHRPAAAAYRAMRLLLDHSPEAIERVFSMHNQQWILPSLIFSTNDGREERQIRSALLRRAYEEHRDTFLSAIDDANASLGSERNGEIASLVADWADGGLLSHLWGWWVKTSSEGRTYANLETIRLFAKYSFPPMLHMFEQLLAKAKEQGSADELCLLLADAFFEEHPSLAKDWLIPLIQQHPEVAIDVIARVTGYWSASVFSFIRSLNEHDAIRVFDFAKTSFPPPVEQQGAYAVTALHSVEQLRERLLTQLSQRGTDAAVQALVVLRDTHKDLPWLQNYVDEGRKAARENSTDWPEPLQIVLVLATGRGSITVDGNAPAPLATVPIPSATDETVEIQVLTETTPPEAAPASERYFTFLLFATEWNSGHGGLSTVNREVATGLAALGHKVLCFVPRPTAEETRKAESVGVSLLRSDGADVMSPNEHLALGPTIPEGVSVDYVIGHDYISGPAAVIWARRLKAAYIHVVHTHPDEIASARLPSADKEIFKHAEAKRSVQLELGKAADLVVAIGPLLTEYVTNMLRKTTPVYQLVPGLTTELLSETPDVTFLPEECCLFVGRGDDKHVKGIDVLAGTIRLLRERAKALGGKVPIMVFRGYADREGAIDLFGHAQGLRFHPFTQDENAIWQDLKTASVLLMPSRAEGFGLVGVESISAGLPVLVSEASGVARFLRKLAEDGVVSKSHVDHWIVPITGEVTEDAAAWSDRIVALMLDRPAAFDRAKNLRESLKQRFTWKSAVAGMIAAISRARQGAEV